MLAFMLNNKNLCFLQGTNDGRISLDEISEVRPGHGTDIFNSILTSHFHTAGCD